MKPYHGWKGLWGQLTLQLCLIMWAPGEVNVRNLGLSVCGTIKMVLELGLDKVCVCVCASMCANVCIVLYVPCVK